MQFSKDMRSNVTGLLLLALVTGLVQSTCSEQSLAQTLPGDFAPFNPWWLNPTNGTLGLSTPSGTICIDLDGNGSTESCYNRPAVAPGASTNMYLSPSRRSLLMFGNSSVCGGSSMVYFYNVPDPPANLHLVANTCIPNNVNPGQIGFYDTGLCCNGLADPSCSSNLGLDCFDGSGGSLLGVSPQRVAYIADQGDPFTQLIQIYWFDLVNETMTRTLPGFNQSLQLTRALVSPYGDVAFVQHDVGGSSDSDYTAVDLCAEPRFGLPLTSIVGGALFNLDLPIATAEMVDNGGGDFEVLVTHPDLLGGALGIPYTPCGGNPPPTTGACCKLDGCTIETSDDCESLTGTWSGPDTACGDCPMATLSVNIEGPGSVTSSPTGISCPSDCDETYNAGVTVSLTANAAATAQFVRWTGDCAGTNATVQVVVAVDRNCTAVFDVVSDLAVDKSDDHDPVIAGTPLSYTITVTNNGPGDASNVTLVDTMPANVSFDPSTSDPSCMGLGNTVTCGIGELASGASLNVDIGSLVGPLVRGSITNRVDVSSSGIDPNIANNFALESTTVDAEADLSVAKSASPEPVAAGARLIYSVEITNLGPSAATGVMMNDTLPPEVMALGNPSNPTQVGCGVTGGAVNPNETTTLSFLGMVDPATPDGTIITNEVEVSAIENDPDPNNNVATVDSTVTTHVTGPAETQFVKVADTDTPIPNGTGNFTALAGGDKPVISQGNVAFRGRGDNQDGIYSWINGVLDVVADTSTPIPGGTGTFGAPSTGGFNSPSMDGTNIAFGGDDQTISQRGVYKYTSNVLSLVADRMTRPSGASTTFSTLGGPSLDGDYVSFWGFIPANPILGGIYLASSGGLVNVASQNTFIPSGPGRFSGFNPNTQQRGGRVAFFGSGPSPTFRYGLYLYDSGSLQRIADYTTPLPDGSGAMDLFWNLMSYDGTNIAFVSHNASHTEPRLFVDDCVGFGTLADFNTPVPCGTGNFTAITDISYRGGNVAFYGYEDDTGGIYAGIDGKLVKVIRTLDELDGKKIVQFRFGREGLYGNQVVFTAIFCDGSQGIYVATVSSSGVCHPYDADDDEDHDLHDQAAFDNCYSGAGNSYDPGCEVFDSDGDNDIDDVDYEVFVGRITGPLPPVPLEACCLDNGTCMMLDPCICDFTYHGTSTPGVDCADDPCQATTGACCSIEGCLDDYDAQRCNGLEGTLFLGQTCADVVCP